jgi:hypothetical protein
VDENLTAHGLIRTLSGDLGLRMGMLSLLGWLNKEYVEGPMFGKNPDPSHWPDRWFDPKFRQAVLKYEDCARKLDRVAQRFADCIDIVNDYEPHTGMSLADYAKFQEAHVDVPILLDSMILYLRMQADCLANAVPNLYGRAAKHQMPRESLRDLARWFTAKRPDFDHGFRDILERHLDWFADLAGEGSGRGQGLRDLIVHYRGTYLISWSYVPKIAGTDGVRASLMNESGFVADNVIPLLRGIVRGYFNFLDQTQAHFLHRLNQIPSGPRITAQDLGEPLFLLVGSQSSVWLYSDLDSPG